MARNAIRTTKIKSKNQWGYVIINESDFDKSVHTLYKECSEPKEVVKEKPKEVITLSLSELAGRQPEEIKAAYNIDILKALAKELKIKNYYQMKEDKLIKKLLERAE